MDRELVSVIIPAYNVDKFLGECVRSLLCQTYTNYEIIIIDDGSTEYLTHLRVIQNKNAILCAVLFTVKRTHPAIKIECPLAFAADMTYI